MRALWLFSLTALAAAAQTADAPLVRGVLLERDAPEASGQLSIRAAGNMVLRYRFDAKTLVERGPETTGVSRLSPGDRVEVLSNSTKGSNIPYALTVHVLAAAEPRQAPLRARDGLHGESGIALAPRGGVKLSGVIARLQPGLLVLRARNGVEQSVLLLRDTRYVEDGGSVDADRLKPNLRVYLEAGRSLSGGLEAYQVVWGGILRPE
jgi:hypothetical protein